MANLEENTSLIVALSEIEKKVVQAEIDRDTLKTNLSNKGVDVSTTNKMQGLVAKVNEIEVERHNIPEFLNIGGTMFYDKTALIPHDSLDTIRIKSCVIGDIIYMIFPHDKYNKDIFTYDMSSNKWGKEPTQLPVAFKEPSVCYHDGFIYITHSSNNSDCYKYNLSNKTFTRISPMPSTCYLTSTCVIDDTIYSHGGSNGNNALSTVYAYDILLDTWSIRMKSTWARYLSYNYNINNDLYSIGGYAAPSESVLKYDVVLNVVTFFMGAPQQIHEGVVSIHNNIVYSFGYSLDSTIKADSCSIDVITKTSTILNDYKSLRRGGCGATYKDSLFLIGGSGKRTGDIYII